MENDKLNRLLPDDVDPREADGLDATWRMLGAIDAPAPDSDRMRARLDTVLGAVEHAAPPASPRWFGRRDVDGGRYALQGLAAIHDRTRGKSGRAFMLSALYVLIVITQGILMVALALFGLADSVFGLRRRFGRRPGPPSTLST